MRSALILLLAVGSLSAAPVPKELRKAGDAKALVGLWAAEANGARFQFAEDGTLQTWAGDARNGHQDWTWAVVDPKATPKRATIRTANGPAKAFDCVYELTGDTLKFALIMFPDKGPVDTVEQHPALQFFKLERRNNGK